MSQDETVTGQLHGISSRLAEMHADVKDLKSRAIRVEKRVDKIYDRVNHHEVDLAIFRQDRKNKREIFMVWFKAIVAYAVPLIFGAIGALAAMRGFR